MYIPEPRFQFRSLCYTTSLAIFTLHFSNLVHIHPAIPLLAWPTLHFVYLGWLRAYCRHLIRELEKRQAVIEQLTLEARVRAAEDAVLVEVREVTMTAVVEVLEEEGNGRTQRGEGAKDMKGEGAGAGEMASVD
jgi:hypothetical protein